MGNTGDFQAGQGDVCPHGARRPAGLKLAEKFHSHIRDGNFAAAAWAPFWRGPDISVPPQPDNRPPVVGLLDPFWNHAAANVDLPCGPDRPIDAGDRTLAHRPKETRLQLPVEQRVATAGFGE